MTKSILFLSVAALLLPACQAGEKPASNTAAANATADLDAGADEQAIRGQVDHWLKLVKAYSVLERKDDAEKALARAKTKFTGNTQALQQLDQLAAELGLKS